MKQKAQVYCLKGPAHQEMMSCLDNNIYHYEYDKLWWTNMGRCYHHHLYFTSDEKIQEGDWVYSTLSNKVFQIDLSKPIQDIRDYKKIIATTNPDLWYKERYGVKNAFSGIGVIPQNFIQLFVDKQGVIKEVELEYEDQYCYVNGEKFTVDEDDLEEPLKLKLNQNGEVIRSLREEKMYTKEDLRNAFNTGSNKGATHMKRQIKTGDLTFPDFDTWFNKNYPQ